MAKKKEEKAEVKAETEKPAAEAPPEAPKKGKRKPAAEDSAKAPAGDAKEKQETAAKKKTKPEAPPTAAPGGLDEPTKKKGRRPGVAPPLGKKLKTKVSELQNRLAKQGPVALEEAIKILKDNKRAKFDETVEVHMWLGIDPKQADQMVRGSVGLPHGIGKSVRLLVFAQADKATQATEAGADHVGGEEIAKKIQSEGWLDFDVALATPDMMGVVGRLGKILGPRGMMPTPKAGTVITGDVATAVREFKAGKVEYRTDSGGNVHAPVGKLSFPPEKLAGNITTFIDQIKAVKPAASKGHYIKSITLSATMSPGVAVAF